MGRYRFLDPMGEVLAEGEFPDHEAALAWAQDDSDRDEDVQRVEWADEHNTWRWAGPLLG